MATKKKAPKKVASAAAATAAPAPAPGATLTPLAATLPTVADVSYVNRPNPPASSKTNVAGNLPDAFTPAVLTALAIPGVAALLGSVANATTIETNCTTVLESEGVETRLANGAAMAKRYSVAPLEALQVAGRRISDQRKEIAAQFPEADSDLAAFFAVWDALHHTGPKPKATAPAPTAPTAPKTPTIT